MQYDFINIKLTTINGIKNPLLVVSGTIKSEEYNFKVLANKKEKKYEIKTITGKDFIIESKLDIKDKNIEVYVKINGKEYLVTKTKNTLIRRIFWRIKGIFSIVGKKIGRFFNLLKGIFITIIKGIKFFWREYHFLVPINMWKKYIKHFFSRVKQRTEKLFNDPYDIDEYNEWIKKYEKEDLELEKFKYNPLISILIPVYNIDRKSLSNCINSILNQTYSNFEICLVDDCSTKEETLETLKEYAEKDDRIKIKYRKENGHISKTTNDALAMAKGEFISLVDDDDELTPNALYEVVKVLNNDKKIDFIYSDEDKLDLSGRRCEPNFKPNWSPDTLLSLNYICHLTTIRKSLVKEVGGFTVGLEGSQDYDLFLRVTEKTDRIYHIPKILYHWRMVKGSTSMTIDNKNYAVERGKQALENALKRRKINGHVEIDKVSTYYRVIYDIKTEPIVSIIIPTKDHADILETCLKSVIEKTTYKNYEIIVVNNNSKEKETFDLFEKYKQEYKNFKVMEANYEFNYSKINNEAIKECNGEYICLLNNDTEIISGEWLTVMVGYAMQPHIGCVGPKLLYPDNTIQHGGVILGLGGVASHAYLGTGKNETGIYGRLRVPYNYGGVTAACLVASRKKLLEVGLLEEDLKVAYNDVDLNIKMLEKGYFNIFIPQVEVYHYESKSRGLDTTPEKLKRFNYEQNYMWNKWKNYLKHDPFYNDNYSKSGWFVLDRNEVIEYGPVEEKK